MIIKCERHGLSLGNYVCDHVQAAIGAWSPAWAGTAMPTTPEDTYRIEREDRTFERAIFICRLCREQFQLGPTGPVPEDLLAEEILEGHSSAFPSVFPSCQGCLDAWLPTRLR